MTIGGQDPSAHDYELLTQVIPLISKSYLNSSQSCALRLVPSLLSMCDLSVERVNLCL
ncbi:hypothetical protein D3C79_950970 [compost metagenome]